MADDELDAMEGSKTDLPEPKGKGLGSPRRLDTKAAVQSAADAEGAMERLKQRRAAIVIDEAGNATHNGTKVPGNFSKLLDIFGELGGKAKEAVGGAVDAVKDTAKGLLKAPDKVISTGNAALGRGAPSVVRAGASRMGAAALSAPAAAFMAVMDPSPANAGEQDPGYRDMRQPVMTDTDNLNDQTQGAMGADPGINPAAKPTMQPVDAQPNPRPDTGIGQAMPQAATMIDNVTGKVGGVQTGGGFYPTYDKGSAEATSFSKAFAEAHKAGLSEFSWQGRRYNTQVASDKSTQARPVTPNP